MGTMGGGGTVARGGGGLTTMRTQTQTVATLEGLMQHEASSADNKILDNVSLFVESRFYIFRCFEEGGGRGEGETCSPAASL
jgi:hypothetical protein